MKSGLTLTQLAQEIERRANAKRDFVVKTDAVVMGQSDDPSGFGLLFADQQVGVNEIAHKQIADHGEIPARYYDKMRKEAPHLLCNNVNEWFRKYPQPRMLRTLDGRARALLSDRFRPLENEDLAQAVLPALIERDLHVMSSQITDTKLYIKAVDPKVQRELEAKGGKFGDGQHNIVRCLAPAITISNSEVGMGALSILGGVYDGFCSNLATFGERSTRKYHVGKQHELGEDVYALLSDETRRKSDAALWAQVGDIVRAAFDRAKFDSLCDKIAETTEQKIEGDPVKVIEITRQRFRNTESEGAAILRHLIEGGDLSRFGLYNAITRTSQDIEDYDRATELERQGAMVIELPKHEWQTISAAA